MYSLASRAICFFIFFVIVFSNLNVVADDSKNNPIVQMKTNKGDIFIELFQKQAPLTVQNFLKYVT